MKILYTLILILKFDQYISSTTEKMVDKSVIRQKIVDKWSIKSTLFGKLVDIMEFVVDKGEFTTVAIVQHFGFTPAPSKRYLRQLTDFGYFESYGGNCNRSYKLRDCQIFLFVCV